VYAQDVHWEERGAFTGQISVSMVRGLAVGTIVGHSEVRRDLGDTDERVAKKLARAVAAGLRPVLCVGESEAEHAAGNASIVVARQIVADLKAAQRRGLERLVVAYEPIWAIGTRKGPYRPVGLCVLDGWGIAPDSPSNAVTRARTPRLRALFETYPHATLRASGRDVGLPDGVMGNSEVGHLTMGAGYIQYQELVRINDSIEDGSFFSNSALRAACAAVRRGTLHLMGLISTGGVHAD